MESPLSVWSRAISHSTIQTQEQTVMPRINDMVESKFLKKEDVGEGALLTITGVTQHNVAKQGAGEELKWCVEFEEIDKPMVLNVTNMRAIEKIVGSDDTDNWTGVKIVLYEDPNISFQGKLTGGIRIRPPKKTVAPKQAALPAEDSNIPF
jgi:hypothetical protein